MKKQIKGSISNFLMVGLWGFAIGCKHFRDMFKAEIVYQRLSDDFVELIIGRFLGK